MKTVKLNSKLLKDAEHLLRKVGAVVNNQAYPSYVYMNPKDYKKLARSIRAQFLKEYPYLAKTKLQSAEGYYLLNYGPVECRGVAEGYALVDTSAIEEASYSQAEILNGR